MANTPDNYDKTFKTLSHALCECANKSFDMYNSAISQFREDSQAQMTAESPVAQKVTQSLDIITAWISLHDRILERFETQDYFGYE